LRKVTIIGGGLAGIEAAAAARRLGCEVRLFEMKPRRFSPAHSMDGLGELVCSNSLKSLALHRAHGVLKAEMRSLGSLMMEAADEARVPAGSALAVDRAEFSRIITERLEAMGVEVVREEIGEIPTDRPLVIATGPLTSEALAASIEEGLGAGNLYFFDAVSPVITSESVDMTKAFFGSRYGKGEDDYLNCPMDEAEYHCFVKELLSARRVTPRSFEDSALFEGCMPIESMAERGPETLRYGPLKPVGLVDPATGRRPAAVVQLRREDRAGTLYNMVGFQTRLAFPEQARVFRLIPALAGAEFVRYGKMHRNTYMDSPRVLLPSLEARSSPDLFFAGQITGVEGYCESGATGIIAGINAARRALGLDTVTPPGVTMTGALLLHITAPREGALEPMNANFGILAPIEGYRRRRERRDAQAERAVQAMEAWKDKFLAGQR